MKKLLSLILLLLLSTQLQASGSFYDLYAHNRTSGKPNLITADFITSVYANYKQEREMKLEERMLKPRMENFAKYLFEEMVALQHPNQERALAYSAMLSLLSKKQRDLVLPDRFAPLKKRLQQEGKLIIDAKAIALSPIMGFEIDYRTFRVPPHYQHMAHYYRAMKFAQLIPFSPSAKEPTVHLLYTVVQKSKRLSNLYNHINSNLDDFVGIPQNKEVQQLFTARTTLDGYIFSHSPKPSIGDIAKAIYPKKKMASALTQIAPKELNWIHHKIKERIINLKSLYDYDFKIFQTLIKNGHLSAFEGYYTQTKQRTRLYTKRQQVRTKNMPTTPRATADIDSKLVETLDVMIEGAYRFSDSFQANRSDKQMIQLLKELRAIATKKEQGVKFNTHDIAFLNGLDLKFSEFVTLRDMPMVIKVDRKLYEGLCRPKAFRYQHRELTTPISSLEWNRRCEVGNI